MLDLNVLAEEMAAIVKEQVASAVAPLMAENAQLVQRLAAIEDRSPGVDEVAIRQMIEAAVAAIPAPRDFSRADVEPIVAAAVERAVAALPAPQDGTSVTVADVVPLIAEQVRIAVAALPPARDGTSVTLADVEPLISSATARAVSALPLAKDGVGLAGALIDRAGSLIITLSDGTLTDLGRVEGSNGDAGLGFDDLSLDYDGERGITLKFVRGEQAKSFPLTVPVIIDRGVYRDGHAYEEGDAVTFGGSLWIAQKATSAKPDGPDTGWRLAVKKGRDGRDMTKVPHA